MLHKSKLYHSQGNQSLKRIFLWIISNKYCIYNGIMLNLHKIVRKLNYKENKPLLKAQEKLQDSISKLFTICV